MFACTGAAIAGGCHYVATAKRLAEEGIDPRQRVKAFPVAVRLLLTVEQASRQIKL